MNGISFAVCFVLTWALWSPASFGRHIAKISDSFEQERAKLRAERETAP